MIPTRHLLPYLRAPPKHLPLFTRSKSTTTTSHPITRSSSPHHHDLPSFLRHAKATNLSRASTYFKGTRYEYLTARTLLRHGLSLARTGGPSDLGIDLLGSWHPPSSPVPIRVVAQCKAHSAKPTPEGVRALEGALGGAPAGWRGSGVLALLVCRRGASRGVREAVGRSGVPMGFVQIAIGDGYGDGDVEGTVEQFVWNQAAAGCGLEGMAVTMKYGGRVGEGGELTKEVVLTWKGVPYDAAKRLRGAVGGDTIDVDMDVTAVTT